MEEINGNKLPRTPQEAIEQRNGHANGEAEQRQIEDHATGYYYWASSLTRQVELGKITRDQADRMIGQVLTRRDLQAENEYIEGRIDPLTRLPKRQELEKTLQELIENEEPFSVLMLDVDFFKKFNDKYGHLAGDQVLMQFGLRLENSIRQAQIHMPEGVRKPTERDKKPDLAVRYGGEEFAVVLRGNLTDEDLENTAGRIRNSIIGAEYLITNNEGKQQQVSVTASIGGVRYNKTKHSGIKEVIQGADRMMYIAKNTGRDKVVIREKVA